MTSKLAVALVRWSILSWTLWLLTPVGAAQNLDLTVTLEHNQSVIRTLRFGNLCRQEHLYQVSSSRPGLVRILGFKEPVTVTAGTSVDVNFEVSNSAGGRDERGAHILVRCLDCETEPDCGQRESVLPVRVSAPDGTVSWIFHPQVQPATCLVTALEGSHIAELFLSKTGQAACIDISPDRAVTEKMPAFRYYSTLDDQWRFEYGGSLQSINLLDGSSVFAPVERFLLGYLETQRISPAGVHLSRPQIVALLLELIHWSRSHGRGRDWMPTLMWISETMARMGGRANPLHHLSASSLSPAEISRLAAITRSLSLKKDNDELIRSAYLDGVPRIELGADAISTDLHWSRDTRRGRLSSFASFQMDALYGDFGYYTTEHASIGRSGHFETVPQKVFPVFGGLIGELAHQIYRNRWDSSSTQLFEIREDGGGRGELARSLLLYLQTQSMLNPQGSYDALWNRLSYYEVEISPERVLEQTEKLSQLKNDGVLSPKKVTVREADATRFRSSPPLHGLIVSNELIDVLPVEKFYVEDTGRVWLVCPIPYLSTKDRDPVNLAREVWGLSGQDVWNESLIFASDYGLPEASHRLYLPRTRFREYQSWLRRQEVDLGKPVMGSALEPLLPSFLEGLVPVERVPRLAELVEKQYADLLAGLVYRGENESEAYLETVKADYLSTLDRSLERGSILIIDYMSVGKIPNNTALLTYSETRSEGRWANPYVLFGLQDITLPPDSTLLIRETQRHGWQVETFAPQESLIDQVPESERNTVGIGMVTAYTRLVTLPQLDSEERPAFEKWLIGEARRARDADELIFFLKTSRSPELSRLKEENWKRLSLIPVWLEKGTRWEPENPNFYLLLARKGQSSSSDPPF